MVWSAWVVNTRSCWGRFQETRHLLQQHPPKLLDCFGSLFWSETVAALDELWGHQRRGSGCLQSQLASQRTIKKTDRVGKTFLARRPRKASFQYDNLERRLQTWRANESESLSDRFQNSCWEKQQRSKLNLNPLLVAQVPDLWSKHQISVWQENYPAKPETKCLDPVYQQQVHWNLSNENVNSQESIYFCPFQSFLFPLYDELVSLMESLYFSSWKL